MDIRTLVYQQTGSISIHGKFDFQLHRKFKQTYTEMLENPAIQEIEVEMKYLDFLDSAALGMLMLLRERAHAVNKSILLSNPTASVFKLLEVANFDKIFPMKRAASLSEDISNWAIQAT